MLWFVVCSCLLVCWFVVLLFGCLFFFLFGCLVVLLLVLVLMLVLLLLLLLLLVSCFCCFRWGHICVWVVLIGDRLWFLESWYILVSR